MKQVAPVAANEQQTAPPAVEQRSASSTCARRKRLGVSWARACGCTACLTVQRNSSVNAQRTDLRRPGSSGGSGQTVLLAVEVRTCESGSVGCTHKSARLGRAARGQQSVSQARTTLNSAHPPFLQPCLTASTQSHRATSRVTCHTLQAAAPTVWAAGWLRAVVIALCASRAARLLEVCVEREGFTCNMNMRKFT